MGAIDYFNNMYGKYFKQLPDKEAYLKRLGLEDSELMLTKESLDKVQFAHLCSIPFENLDIFDYGIKIDFGTDEMFDKAVKRRRGGYCFELNAIYMELLEAIGFEVYPVGVRIVMGRDSAKLPPIAHRASIVTIGGKRYYTDVGFGTTSAPGISIGIDTADLQDIQGDTYSVEDRPHNTKVILHHTNEGPSPLFVFSSEPFNRLDFISYNTTMQATGFRVKRMANLRKPGGSISVDGDIFRKTQGDERIEVPIKSGAEAFKILTEEFNMILTEPLGDVASVISELH